MLFFKTSDFQKDRKQIYAPIVWYFSKIGSSSILSITSTACYVTLTTFNIILDYDMTKFLEELGEGNTPYLLASQGSRYRLPRITFRGRKLHAWMTRSWCCSCDPSPEYMSYIMRGKRFHGKTDLSPFYSHANVPELFMLEPFKNKKPKSASGKPKYSYWYFSTQVQVLACLTK